MNISRIKNGLQNRAMQYINARRGWKTDRKIVVIESDDWGAVRMPDRKTYNSFLSRGIRVDQCNYCKFDSLASKDDFDELFTVLKKHKDFKGNNPVITANSIMANPDFNAIKETKYQTYSYELFTETLRKYPNRSFDLWKTGIDEKLFFPQLHGREHLNIGRWMRALISNSAEMHYLFQNNFYGLSHTISREFNSSFLAALDYDNENDAKTALQSIEEATDIFKKSFGYHSKSFIAPNYVWDTKVEEILSKKGVTYLQGSFIQKTPESINKYHYTGESNLFKQIYMTRNVIFEPSTFINKDWVHSALSEINNAFKFKKPAIICSHRVTFIGGIFEENRTKNLKLLNELLTEILKKWPDVEFMHSSQLGDEIKIDSI